MNVHWNEIVGTNLYLKLICATEAYSLEPVFDRQQWLAFAGLMWAVHVVLLCNIGPQTTLEIGTTTQSMLSL